MRKDEFLSLFNPLATQFGIEAVLGHIHSQTDIAPLVVEEWKEGKRTPSSGIQKSVVACLKNARPDDFPRKYKSLKELPSPAPPSSVGGSPRNPARRKAVIQHNEQALDEIRKNLKSRNVILEEIG